MTDRLDRFSPPEPPPELRARVLEAARASRAVPRWSATWVDRCWESRSLRSAWLLAAVLLLALRLTTEPSANEVLPPPVPEPSLQAGVEELVWQLARHHREMAARPSPDRRYTWPAKGYLEELER